MTTVYISNHNMYYIPVEVTWNGVFLSFCVPFLVFRSYVPFSLFLVPFRSLFIDWLSLFSVSGLLYFWSPRNISRYSSVSQIPVSYSIPVQCVMIHHDISPSLDAYVHVAYPGLCPHDSSITVSSYVFCVRYICSI